MSNELLNKLIASNISSCLNKQASSLYSKGIGSVVRRRDNNGLIEKGNIDIYNRPKVRLPNGDIATVRTISVGNQDGHEVLIPTISDDGKVLSNEEAINLWKRTGKHLGIYKDIASANKAGQLLHKQQEDYYLKR